MESSSSTEDATGTVWCDVDEKLHVLEQAAEREAIDHKKLGDTTGCHIPHKHIELWHLETLGPADATARRKELQDLLVRADSLSGRIYAGWRRRL